MIKKALLPLACLLLGIALGYDLRDVSVSDKKEVARGRSGQDKRSVGGQTLTTDKNGVGIEISADISLSDLMKEVLEGPDTRLALKAVEKLSVQQIKSALALVAGMPKSYDRDRLRGQLYAVWSASDLTAAWKAALADPLNDENGDLACAAAKALTKSQPVGVINLVMDMQPGRRRTAVMNSIITEWGLIDLPAAIAYTNAHPELPIELLNFCGGLTRLSIKDPLTAANLAVSLKDIMSRSYILSGVMEAWVKHDSVAAFNWAQRLTNTELREDVMAQAVCAWADSDPKSALDYAQRLADGDSRIKSFSGAWSRWLKTSPTAAMNYLRTTQDKQLLGSVQYSMTIYVGTLGSQEQQTFLSQLPEGEVKQGMYGKIAFSKTLAGQYNEALQAFNRMTDSEARDRQLTQFAQKWAKTDFPTATRWIKSQPDSSDRDLALTGYAFTLAASDPISAANWVQTISDAALQRDAKKLIAFRWYQSDSAGAQAWMNGAAGLSESDQKFVRLKAQVPGDYLPLTPAVTQRR